MNTFLGQVTDATAAHDTVRVAAGAHVAPHLSLPSYDLSAWLERLGCKLFWRDRPLIQYVAWCYELGLLDILSDGPISATDVISRTRLNEHGADALLGVLSALGIATRAPTGYSLSKEAREFFSPSSPFFIGGELYAPGERIPPPYLANSVFSRTWVRLIHLLPSMRCGRTDRLTNQHARNLPACIAAARSGAFSGLKCLVDVAGGSGAFAIPLALDYPTTRIVLADLPTSVKNVKQLLAKHGLAARIELFGMNAFEYPWKIPACDGVFLGNFLHGFDDDTCISVCRESFERLDPGGKIFIHEMVWNANRDGPLITALWNASMRAGGGKQRTTEEFGEMLRRVGFTSSYSVATAGAFALTVATKPR